MSFWAGWSRNSYVWKKLEPDIGAVRPKKTFFCCCAFYERTVDDCYNTIYIYTPAQVPINRAGYPIFCCTKS